MDKLLYYYLEGGEDAMFVSNNVIVAADGVGGWIEQGIDSGLYPKNCHNWRKSKEQV